MYRSILYRLVYIFFLKASTFPRVVEKEARQNEDYFYSANNRPFTDYNSEYEQYRISGNEHYFYSANTRPFTDYNSE